MESPEYIIWLHSSVEIELPKQQSHFPNESMQNLPEKKSEILQQFTGKKLSFYFRYVRLAH